MTRREDTDTHTPTYTHSLTHSLWNSLTHWPGNLPDGCCNPVIEYMLATFSGLAFAFLFLSIVLAIKVILL